MLNLGHLTGWGIDANCPSLLLHSKFYVWCWWCVESYIENISMAKRTFSIDLDHNNQSFFSFFFNQIQLLTTNLDFHREMSNESNLTKIGKEFIPWIMRRRLLTSSEWSFIRFLVLFVTMFFDCHHNIHVYNVSAELLLIQTEIRRLSRFLCLPLSITSFHPIRPLFPFLYQHLWLPHRNFLCQILGISSKGLVWTKSTGEVSGIAGCAMQFSDWNSRKNHCLFRLLCEYHNRIDANGTIQWGTILFASCVSYCQRD